MHVGITNIYDKQKAFLRGDGSIFDFMITVVLPPFLNISLCRDFSMDHIRMYVDAF